MDLVPIKKNLEDNAEFLANPLCDETLRMTVDFYERTGYTPPWICYYGRKDGSLVGSAGYKGPPLNGTIEIAYGTFEAFRRQGIGELICRELVKVALGTDPSVRITARTLPEKNFSTRILEKNNFKFSGTVIDPEDGEVWEWEFQHEDNG